MDIEKLDQIEKKDDKELVRTLQDLIKIPSFVPQKPPEARLTQNENKVVDYLEEWLNKNTNLITEKQELDGGRFNLIAKKGKPDLVFLGHTDTVAPSIGARYDNLAAEIHDGKVWGRGSSDMKAGLATMIQALSLVPDADNIWAFFYADEEYDFLGMKGLVEKYSDIRPKLIVSSDGSDLKIGHGCRGCIEIRSRIKGITGHAAKGNGLNAIDGVTESLNATKGYFREYRHPVMGDTSINLAYLLGGQEGSPDKTYAKGLLKEVGQEGNVIADIAEFVIDVRPSSPDLTPRKITDFLAGYLKDRGYPGFEIIKVRHDLGAWYTEKQDIAEYKNIADLVTGADVQFEEPGKSGYIDLQMFWDKVGRPPAFTFGGGDGATAHKPDENIKITNLIKERDFFTQLLIKQTTK